MTPLERAAQALVGARINEPGYNGDWDEDDVILVRAVLNAIREPSEAMLNAGAQKDQWVQGEGQDPQPEVYTAMIDAALAEDG